MKTVIITGANGNLGTAVTQTFLNKGYRVIATVFEEKMIAEFISHTNLDVRVVNLSDDGATAGFIASVIRQYEKIDAALMLVGGFAMGGIDATAVADIDKQISLNFKTAYHVTQPVLQHMKAHGAGRLVFIGARPAIEASQGKDMVAYGLSKSLLFKLAEYINAENKGSNITATVVAPSTLDTPLNRKSMPNTDPEIWVKPAALAEILEFVVSDKSEVIREAVLKVYNNA
ncbi:SDR family NAD(P)-dependent oxidoreductase [Sediminibacterium roseum]|uniref:SDR family NAD(P)-dependent oxidoreductase n=1 Tax=Sediminibacterium roseum TaxID=1978412 RepID=A0ABX0A212_9BACT|nr:SDR family NAD(P)-dependent oxidoreductase [Sediminibacterium roseum]NCI51443.1 SDR family NAD(P)-dependent oxidoreductase [Sediminibacterium roseum]